MSHPHLSPDDPSAFDNSIRRDESRAVAQEVVNRLGHRDVPLTGDEDPAELADLLSAIEGFERAVQAAGGDLMVDSPESSQPERPEWVVPRRWDDEAIAPYTDRVRQATARVESTGWR